MDIRKMYRTIVPLIIREKIWNIRNYQQAYLIKYGYEKRSFGNKNPDIIFFVYRSDFPERGIFSVWQLVIMFVKYSIDRGYVPVIDLKNYYMAALQDEVNKFKENAWEYYFEQPFPQYSLEEVYQSKNVLMSSLGGGFPYDFWNYAWSLPLPENGNLFWNRMAMKYTRLQGRLLEQAQELKKKLFPEGKKVLGVSLRRGFQRAFECGDEIVNNHPIQAELSEYIDDILVLCKEWLCDFIFISTEDREALETFVKVFGKKCIYVNRPRYIIFENGKTVQDLEHTLKELNGIENTTFDYVTEIILLSECDCLLGGGSGGLVAAYVFNGNRYEHVKIYNKGSYSL